MSPARWAVGLAGATVVAAAAFAQAWGLVGMAWAWPDALNHFAPVWLALAVIGTLVAWLALPPSRGRGLTLIAALFVVLAAGVPIGLEAWRARIERDWGAPTLTLVSLNRWWTSPDGAREAEMIRRSGADLVALQEADGFGPEAASLKDLYPYQLFCGGDCDTAILSKRPFLGVGKEDHARWRPGSTDLLWARTTARDGRPVTLATTHLFWPIPPWIQKGQRARLIADLSGLPKDELILAGDFNLTPWSFAMRSFDREIAPLTRRTHGLLTFPATWPLPFLAPDEVFAGPGWRTVSIRRGPRAGSDHFPVAAQFRR